MENFTKTQEDNIYLNKKSEMILSSSKLKRLNLKNFNKSNIHFKNRDFIISKDKIISHNIYNFNNKQFSLSCDTPRKDFSSQYPVNLLNNEIIKLFSQRYNNRNPKNIIKKIDIENQIKNIEKMTKNKKFQFFKKIIEHSNNNYLDDIDCILESPYRGVEKIGDSLSKTFSQENDKNIFRPIFINDNYKGYFCINNSSEKKYVSLNHKSTIKKINSDKYNEVRKSKEIDNPLKRLSRLSGLPCSKIRKAINYSLSHRMNNFGKIIKKKFNIKVNNNDNSKNKIEEKQSIIETKNNKNKHKCIYSKIALKSRKINGPKLIKSNSINKENDNLLDNVIGNNFFKDKKYKKNYYKGKRFTYYSPISSRERHIFKNITIKGKIGALFK